MGFDFVHALDSDVSYKILMCLDDPADVVRASSVSRSWYNFVVANGICKHLCIKLFPQLSGVIRVIDVSNTKGKCSDGCSSSLEWEHLKKEHRVFTSLAQGLTSSEVGDCLLDAIGASSTDNYPEESARNTLEPRDRVGRRASYWSSSGQSNPQVPERLTYKLISDLCIITEINIRPFQAFFQANHPIYSSKAVRFRLGHRILPDDDEEDLKGRRGHVPADEKFVWTYTSPEFPMDQESRLQNFKLPQPILCIGGIMQIELLGRVQTQEMDSLYYICIAYVQVMGRSLSPVFGVESVEPSGRFLLTYNPLAQFSTPHLHEDPDEITLTPEMAQRHVRGWEQILNMLRGTLGVEVYDSEDEHPDSDEEMLEEEPAL